VTTNTEVVKSVQPSGGVVWNADVLRAQEDAVHLFSKCSEMQRGRN
jgi:hypothetical protein